MKKCPDHSNEFTKAAEIRLGAFVYDQDDQLYNIGENFQKGPFELDNGAIYHGQWSKNGLRDGKGT